MSFLGKLMIVCVLVMSLLFMTIGLVVQQTHRDLQAESKLLQQQVSEAQETYNTLVEKQKRIDRQLLIEDREALHQLRKLEFELVALRQRDQQLYEEYEDKKAERRDLTSRAKELQEGNVQLGEQVETTNEEIASNRTARDEAFVKGVQSTEELHQLQGQLQRTLERKRNLERQLGTRG